MDYITAVLFDFDLVNARVRLLNWKEMINRLHSSHSDSRLFLFLEFKIVGEINWIFNTVARLSAAANRVVDEWLRMCTSLETYIFLLVAGGRKRRKEKNNEPVWTKQRRFSLLDNSSMETHQQEHLFIDDAHTYIWRQIPWTKDLILRRP